MIKPPSDDLPVPAITGLIGKDNDPARSLRRFTDARVALGRSGTSLPTAAHLAFLHDHARARDAVWSAADMEGLANALHAAGLASITIDSAAPDRATYLRRPDLGRRLGDGARTALQQNGVSGHALSGHPLIGIIIADGLSALAVDLNAAPITIGLIGALTADGHPLAPVILARQGRVALGDAVGEVLGLDLAVVLIGERPGLSAADSLGCYITWQPRPGTADAARNCVSNIRLGGLLPELAITVITNLVRRILAHRISGVALPDEGRAGPALIP